MTVAYQLIRTDAEGAELICGNGDLGPKVYSEHHVKDMASILNGKQSEFKYSYSEVPDPVAKLSRYDRYCMYFGFVFMPMALGAIGFKLVKWWLELGFSMVKWMVS